MASSTNTYPTHLPPVHVGFTTGGHLMNWEIDEGVAFIVVEEPFGIIGMDLHLAVGIGNDGFISGDEEDLFDYQAISADDPDTVHAVEMDTALCFVVEEIIPAVRKGFPLPRKGN